MSEAKSQSYEPERNLLLVHEAMIKKLKPALGPASKTFHVNSEQAKGWRGFPVAVLYCFNIHDGEDMSCVKQATAVQKLSVRCKTSMKEILQSESQEYPKS